MDATEMLRYYARMQALSVVHLWDAPDVVLDYLMTGDETLQKAASAAAFAAGAIASAGASQLASCSCGSVNAARGAWRDAANAAGTRDAARKEFNDLVFECFEGPLNANR